MRRRFHVLGGREIGLSGAKVDNVDPLAAQAIGFGGYAKRW